jgi:lipoate-protein ligase A
MLVASWEGPVVVLGYAQPDDQVDLQWCAGRGIPVLRRLSGGTGVIHRRDLSVSLALPRAHPWAGGIVGLYSRFLDALEPALHDLGSRVARIAEPARATRVRSAICFEDQLADTLAVEGRKAVGCSQTRRTHAVLIHAAVLLGLDPALYAKIFGVEESRVKAGLAAALVDVDRAHAAERVAVRFGQALGLDPDVVQRPALDADALATSKLPRWSPVPDGGIG